MSLLVQKWFDEDLDAPVVSGNVTGTVAATAANATSAASGTVTVSGSVAASAANATSAASGTVTVSGAVAVTAANATSAASGVVTVSGAVAATAANATSSASGTVTVTGTVAVTAADATSSASGTVSGGPITGTVAVTLEDSAAAAAGTVTVSGTIAATAADATGNASGSVGSMGLPFIPHAGGPDEDDDDLLDAKHERRYPKFPEVPAIVPTPIPVHRPEVVRAAPIERRRAVVALNDAVAHDLRESAEALASVREVIGQASTVLTDEAARLAFERDEMEMIALAVVIAMDDE